MFLAWNEIRRNKLKFGLIIGVLTMISYLLFYYLDWRMVLSI